MAGNKSRYRPVNPTKYVGDPKKLLFRSDWERKLGIYCDMNPSVIAWAVESVVIPYHDPVKGKDRRYFMDFYIKRRLSDGSVVQELVEVKPDKETRLPVKPKRNTIKGRASYQYACLTYATNMAKWEAATRYANRNGMSFKLCTEHQIYKNGKK